MFTWQFSFMQEIYMHTVSVMALGSNEDYIMLSIL